MTIKELAAYMIEHSDTQPVPEIDLETAIKYIFMLDPYEKLPADLNAKDFMDAWNDIIRTGKEGNS